MHVAGGVCTEHRGGPGMQQAVNKHSIVTIHPLPAPLGKKTPKWIQLWF